MEVEIKKYRIYKDSKLTGLIYDSIGIAISDIIRMVSEEHKKNYVLQIGINPKHIAEYTIVRAIDPDNVLLMTFKIEVNKERMKFIDSPSDYEKE